MLALMRCWQQEKNRKVWEHGVKRRGARQIKQSILGSSEWLHILEVSYGEIQGLLFKVKRQLINTIKIAFIFYFLCNLNTFY